MTYFSISRHCRGELGLWGGGISGRAKNLTDEQAESGLPLWSGYEWVDTRVTQFFFQVLLVINNQVICLEYTMLTMEVEVGIISLKDCIFIDNVSMTEGNLSICFYMYNCMFSYCHVRLPFDEFTMGVIWTLKVAPNQLHLNLWALLQAFHLICGYSICVIPSKFSYTSIVLY